MVEQEAVNFEVASSSLAPGANIKDLVLGQGLLYCCPVEQDLELESVERGRAQELALSTPEWKRRSRCLAQKTKHKHIVRKCRKYIITNR